MDVKVRVNNGIQLLNRVDPTWFTKINTDTLDIYTPRYCVLGQWNSGCYAMPYTQAISRLFPGMNCDEMDKQAFIHGFLDDGWDESDCLDLTKEWKRRITELQKG